MIYLSSALIQLQADDQLLKLTIESVKIMILKLAKLLCYLGLHRFKIINIEFGFNPTDRMTTLECKCCGYTKIKTGD